jgi:hypothetical protein
MNRARHRPCSCLCSAESCEPQACESGLGQAEKRTARTEGEMMALDMVVIANLRAGVTSKGKIKNPVYRSALSYASKETSFDHLGISRTVSTVGKYT